MKDKFIRVTSPPALLFTVCFDAVVLFLCVLATARLFQGIRFYSVAFAVIAAILVPVAVLTTREQMKNGVHFRDKKIEFTGLDEHNVYAYADIEKAEVYKDTGASLKKNFVERYSSVILYLKNGEVATVELGVTTKSTLKKIENELQERIKKTP